MQLVKFVCSTECTAIWSIMCYFSETGKMSNIVIIFIWIFSRDI